MSDDLIKRSDAIEAMEQRYQDILRIFKRKVKDGEKAIALDMIGCVKALPSADRPSEIIYGNEHNCIMTIFGECSYAETGCGDCAVVGKVRKALSSDRPQGEWIDIEPRLNRRRVNKYKRCSHCGFSWARPFDDNYCPSCGARMKGAEDEV